MRRLIFLSFLFTFFILKANAQSLDGKSFYRQKFGVEYRSYGIGDWSSEKGRGRKGFNAFYSWKILGNKKYQFYISPQIGYLFDPGIQTRLLQTASLDYNLNISKRLELGAFFALSHVLTKLDFDRYEYNSNGDFENKGKFRSQFSPSYGGRLGWKLIKKADYSVSPYLGLSFIKLDRSYDGTIKGYKRAASIGITFNF